MKHGTLIPKGEKHITEYAFDAVATAEICVYIMLKFNDLPFYLITHHCSLSTFTFKSPSFDGPCTDPFTMPLETKG